MQNYPNQFTEPSEIVVCPSCEHSSVSLLYYSSDYNRQTTVQPFAVYCCDSCKTGITYPQLNGEKLTAAYPKIYYNLTAFTDLNIETSKFYSYQFEKINKINHVVKRGKLLDLGCGVGSFVFLAQKYGYQSEGLEISQDAVDFGRTTFHINIKQGEINSFPLEDNSYDIVTMWHVLEHLANPKKVLQKIHHKLNSNGIVVIAVPNFASIQAQVFRARWYHLDVPRHFYHYSVQGLSRLLSKAGFEVEVVDYFSREHNWAGISGSILDLHALRKESMVHKFIRKTFAYYMSLLIARIEAIFRRGGTMTIIARKIKS